MTITTNGTPDDDFDRKLDRIADNLEVLTDQVGRLTETLGTGFQDFDVRLRQVLEVTDRQEHNISRLVRIVEMLLEQQSENQS